MFCEFAALSLELDDSHPTLNNKRTLYLCIIVLSNVSTANNEDFEEENVFLKAMSCENSSLLKLSTAAVNVSRGRSAVAGGRSASIAWEEARENNIKNIMQKQTLLLYYRTSFKD